jgi:cytochrome P450
LLDILVRPTLIPRVIKETDRVFDPSQKDHLAIDVPKLLTNPLLQSIYSEELRLRDAVMIQRTTLVPNFKIGDWKFPKGDMIIASSWHEGRDRNVWNEGSVGDNFHSVEDFWADRFIVYPHDPNSGPGKAAPGGKKPRPAKSGGEPYFTTDPVLGSFIPYGGGQKICPGRFFAKQEAMASVALFLRAFDIELTNKDLPQPNMLFFPFGVVQPKGDFSARIRRRRV